MKKYILYSLVIIAALLNSCSAGSPQDSNLQATDFAAKIKEQPAAPVIDVRTPEEFAKGHLVHAKNIDWNGNDFDKGIAPLDKSKPVFVYCLSGGRSSSAAAKMRKEGFTQVYELAGGIMKWRGANLPETTDNSPASAGMTKPEFDALLHPGKFVLVDFYADWCAPCKKMKPYLEEIAKDMADSVVVIRINADDNQALCKELKIDALPVLQVYKNKTLTWNNPGYIEKEEILKHIR